MKNSTKNIIGLALALIVFLITIPVMTYAQSQETQEINTDKNISGKAPDIADIIPLAERLNNRLSNLKNTINTGPNIAEITTQIRRIEAELESFTSQFQQLRKSKKYRYNQLVALEKTVTHETESFLEISNTIHQTASQMDVWRKAWLAEKKRWNDLEVILDKEADLYIVKSTFGKAKTGIDSALYLIRPRMERILLVQEKAETIRTKIDDLSAALSVLISEEGHSILLDKSPPILSLRYFSQLKNIEVWYAVQNSLHKISWINSRYFDRQAWVFLLQGFLSVFIMTVFYRNRKGLTVSGSWYFLSNRPFSAGLFLGYMLTALIYEYGGAPITWKILNSLIGAISFSRLMGNMLQVAWKRKFIYVLMITLIVTRAMTLVSFPIPVFRLYTFLVSIIYLFLCLRFAARSVVLKESLFYYRLLHLSSLFFAVIIIAELCGKQAFALYIFVSLIPSIAMTLVFVVFMYMIRGGIEWIVFRFDIKHSVFFHNSDPKAVIRQAERFMGAVASVLVLVPVFLLIWGVYDSLETATKGLMSFGFTMGSQWISVGTFIQSAGILYGAFFVSWIVQKLMINIIFARQQMEMGARFSISRLLHYVIMLTGCLLAISALGFEIAKITLMISALGVGIGFGLQGIVNNFVSGIVLLFERPVRVGDIIEISGKWAKINKIGIRATTVQTLDHSDLIIPNADLIYNQVTNWTLTNRLVRLSIAVGVTYGSDVPLVMKTLQECAEINALVAKKPEPQILFLEFGGSSLNFELRIWVLNADYRLRAKSELNQAIDRRFREKKIEIAFPQLDIHMKTVTEQMPLNHG